MGTSASLVKDMVVIVDVLQLCEMRSERSLGKGLDEFRLP